MPNCPSFWYLRDKMLSTLSPVDEYVRKTDLWFVFLVKNIPQKGEQVLKLLYRRYVIYGCKREGALENTTMWLDRLVAEYSQRVKCQIPIQYQIFKAISFHIEGVLVRKVCLLFFNVHFTKQYFVFVAFSYQAETPSVLQWRLVHQN